MDSKIKFRVLNSFLDKDRGIITELANVTNTFPEKAVLKSKVRNLFWEIESKISAYSSKKINSLTQEKEVDEIQTYCLKSIGPNFIPEVDEDLVFHATTFLEKIEIVAIYDDYFLLENEKQHYKAVIPKRKVTHAKKAKIGDFIRHCEHQYHDLVDTKGNFIIR